MTENEQSWHKVKSMLKKVKLYGSAHAAGDVSDRQDRHELQQIEKEIWALVREERQGDLALSRQIAALPLLIEVCEEIAREPYPDSDPASLLETLRQRAKLALAKAAGETTEPTNP